jgi:hypothetical protein
MSIDLSEQDIDKENQMGFLSKLFGKQRGTAAKSNEGKIIFISDTQDWKGILLKILEKKDNHLRVVILRNELDVRVIDAGLRMRPKVYGAGVTSIGYGTSDQENDALLLKTNPIVLIPKDIFDNSYQYYYPPIGSSGFTFFILRQDKRAIRVIQKLKTFTNFNLIKTLE